MAEATEKSGRPIAATIVAILGVILLIYLHEWSRTPISNRALVCLLILLIGCCFLLLFYRNFRFQIPVNQPESFQLLIAVGQLALFATSLLLAAIAAAFSDPTLAEKWLEIFKSGFLLLGGGLTTITGYYFGSRQTRQAVSQGAEMDKQAMASRNESDLTPRPRTSIKKKS
jgi:hypothetical protein